MNKLSDKVYDYILNESNYDIDEVIEKITQGFLKRTMNDVGLDECGIYYGDGDEYFAEDLDTYTKEIFKNTCELVINVIKSFEEEE